MSSSNLVGVLELNCGKTYGRQRKNTNGKVKEGKLFYGINHDYSGLPYFKVPYEVKHNGTSRYVKDKYVVFTYKNNDDNAFTERPEAQLVETIGDIDDETAFAYYMTLKNGLKTTSSWTKELQFVKRPEEQNKLIEKSNELLHSCQTCDVCEIFTIDPYGCKDMDDGIGIKPITNNEGHELFDIAIAITHVPSFLITSNITSNQLIQSLANTCSLYLPDRVINMIPKHLAENVCSFVTRTTEKMLAPALVHHIVWNNTTNHIVKQELKIECVIVKHNFVYDTAELLAFDNYNKLFDVVKNINSHYKSFDSCQTINDSHDVVAYLMTFMNFFVADWLREHNLPCIYRVNKKRDISKLPTHLTHLERKIGNYAGEYCYYDETDLSCLTSNTKDTTIWTHITSPMRRLADLTNMITISLYIQPEKFDCLTTFRDYCLSIVKRISNEYKLSRRVSLDCELFSFAKQNMSNHIDDKIFTGIIIDTSFDTEDTTNYTKFNYTIYIEELSRMFNINVCEYDCQTKYNLYDSVNCKIIMFDEAHNIKQKVRLMIV